MALLQPGGLPLGASYLGDGRCHFRLWAPDNQQVEVHLLGAPERYVELASCGDGYFEVTVEGVAPATLYTFRRDGSDERSDPASRAQPEGVHGPSAVVDLDYAWTDAGWAGLPLEQYVVYEMHVGTFTAEGTFDAVIPHLDELKDLGITALELLPVAGFPGTRNWGYDGTFLYTTQQSYGGPQGLQRLVDACHQRGMAVVLDVVYNHFGPEGNYLWGTAPYFTDRYRTPWGSAINYDGAQSDPVRRFFIENACFWIEAFHIDALRLDAVHAIYDFSGKHILREINDYAMGLARRLNRQVHLIAESDLNDSRLIRPVELGGYGLAGQWADDFHHAVHTLLTGENNGYYEDFGSLELLAKSFEQGYAYAGDYSPHRRRRHGNSPKGCQGRQFVVCTQNHDQVGNRAYGDRLSSLVSFDQLKLAAGLLCSAPFVPMIFMGEEYGETAPFQYFTSHSDPALVEGVRQGRRREFAAFAWQGEVPDPQAEETFNNSRLNHALKQEGPHKLLWQLYRDLLRLRRELPALADLNLEQQQVIAFPQQQSLLVRRWSGADQVCALFNLGAAETSLQLPLPGGLWRKVLASSDPAYSQGETAAALPDQLPASGQLSLAGHSFGLYQATG